MRIDVAINDREVRALLSAIERRAGNMRPGMELIGDIVRRSVQRNFQEGGRPDEWKSSNNGGKTLIGKGMGGGLMGSITYEARDHSVEVGTNKVYAAVHQFGINRKVNVRAHRVKVKSRDIRRGGKLSAMGVGFVKAHDRLMKIPARPYLLVQDEDWKEIHRALARYIAGEQA